MTSLDQLRKGCAVITGAGSGIGLGLAAHAATEIGIPVAVMDVSAERAEAAVAGIRSRGGVAEPWAVDVTDPQAMGEAAPRITGRLGPVTFLAANAGVEHAGSLWSTTPAQWERVMSVNVNGVFNTVHAFLPAVIESGHRAHVLCTSSIGGIAVGPLMGPYFVSKHAVRTFAQCLAADVHQAGADIGVSILLPGAVQTRIFEDATSSPGAADADAYRAEMTRLLATTGISPDEVAGIAFDAILRDELWVYPHEAQARGAIAAAVATLTGSLPPG
jgi:NAD(P)-dependent dehydrogenase (short-subunit alcohol dehydrogenase family)